MLRRTASRIAIASAVMLVAGGVGVTFESPGV